MSARGAHFDDIVASYAHAMEDLAPVYEGAAAILGPLARDRVVLDIGAGGRFAYDDALPSRLIAVDLSAKMLAQIANPRVEIVVDDATEMRAIADESVDLAVFCLVLHHITGSTRAATLERLDAALDAAYRKLRPGGYVAILEVCLPAPLYVVESLFYPLTRAFLAARSRDMIFLFRAAQIARRLTSRFGAIEERRHLSVTGWYDPLAGSFPGRVRIPGRLSPTPFWLFTARK